MRSRNGIYYSCLKHPACTRQRLVAPSIHGGNFPHRIGNLTSALALQIALTMRDEQFIQVPQLRWLPFPASVSEQPTTRASFLHGLKRRWMRERRRRKVGRAYDMALEIARAIPKGSEVLDVGCGNGFIAHHLSAMLGRSVLGIDVGTATEAALEYRRFDGIHFPLADRSVDAVLLCYVLHHAQDIEAILNEVRRVLREGGRVIIYEDIPATWWDKGVCWVHNRQWKNRTGPCTFRNELEWRSTFESAGFEIIHERQLSRLRNLMHPVCRTHFCLRSVTIPASFLTTKIITENRPQRWT
jgi:ubiquinone/menaquinone biosynthesis C-methylase UbiE